MTAGLVADRQQVEDVCLLAQNLARNCGFSVFPCSASKTPTWPKQRGGCGYKDASTDPERIAWLWKNFPGPLIGIATGEVSGIAVLDIDSDYDVARTWYHANLYRIPRTAAYRTRSGGVHFYFRYSDGIRCKQGSPVPGIDVRGEGGYVISWFSAGLPCLDDAPLAPFPDWLRAAFWPPRPQPPPSRSCDTTRSIDALIRTVAQAVEGTRNGKLFWAANRMREQGFGQRDAERELLPAAFNSGLSEIEARRTIRSAWRA